MEKVNFRPLGKILNIVQSLGLEINHYYDDLFFVSNTTFIIQHDNKNENKIIVHFNRECAIEDSEKIFPAIKNLAKKENLIAIKGKIFSLSQVEGKEEIQLEFV